MIIEQERLKYQKTPPEDVENISRIKEPCRNTPNYVEKYRPTASKDNETHRKIPNVVGRYRTSSNVEQHRKMPSFIGRYRTKSSDAEPYRSFPNLYQPASVNNDVHESNTLCCCMRRKKQELAHEFYPGNVQFNLWL